MTVTKEKYYIIKPKASVNLCTNPSFEKATTGWTTGGTNTIARSTEQQRRAAFSLKCTYNDNDLLASYAITLTDTDHVAGVDIYVPSTYTGTQLTLSWTDYVTGVVVDGLVDMTIRNRWQRIYCHVNPDGADLVGTLTLIETGTNGASGQSIYIDGVLIEVGTVPTTYFDGDFTETLNNVRQYYWTLLAHASTSVRLATTRSGGELIDIEDFCLKLDVTGLGIAPADITSIPLVDGTKRYQGTNLTSRFITFSIAFAEETIGEAQASRDALIDLIKPDLTPHQQPLIIRYQGETDTGVKASEPVDIECVYVSGLDRGLQRNVEQANVVFEVQKAHIKRDGNSAVAAAYSNTLVNANYIIKRNADGSWTTLPSLNGRVLDMKIHPTTKELWIAGYFTAAGGDANANYLARLDTLTNNWVAIGTGLNAYATCIAFYGDGTHVIIGGNFTLAGGVAVERITWYRHDFDIFARAGHGGEVGPNRVVRGLHFVKDSTILYAVGEFDSMGGAATARAIGRTTNPFGMSWQALSPTVMSGYLWTIEMDAFYNVYVAGTAVWTGLSGLAGFAKYNPLLPTDRWSKPYSGAYTIASGATKRIVIDGYGNLFLGGNYTDAMGIGANKIMKFTGQGFQALGKGLDGGDVEDMAFDRQGNLHIVGAFTAAGGMSLFDKMAIYLGNGIYKRMDINLPSVPTVERVLFDDDNNGYYAYNGSGTAYSSGVNWVNNDGKAKTYPIIVITGAGSLRQIVNTTTGKGIYFNDLALVSNEKVVLDFRRENIKMMSDYRGSVLGYVSYGSSYDMFLLPGQNEIMVFMDGVDASTSVTFIWEANYHGVDGARYV